MKVAIAIIIPNMLLWIMRVIRGKCPYSTISYNVNSYSV